jgi:hypothetical protein
LTSQLPLGAVVPFGGERNQPLGNGAQALQLGVVVRRQGALGAGLGHHLRVLLAGGCFQRFGRHQLAQARGVAHLHLRQRGRGSGAPAASRKPRRPDQAEFLAKAEQSTWGNNKQK